MFAQIDHMPAHRREPVVKITSELADLFGVFGQVFLPPAVSDRAKKSDKRSRCRKDDVLLYADLDKLGLIF